MAEVSWTTLEFEEKDRHPDWVWYAGLIAGIVATISFFYGNIFFGIFVVIAGITVIIYAFRAPQQLLIQITAEGVTINEELIPFAGIKQFWLDESEKQDKLLLLVKTTFFPMTILPVQGVKSEDVRAALTGNVPEVLMHDSASAKIFDRLGF